MKEKSFRNYKVVETKDMSAVEIQKILTNATDGFPEMQIDHVMGTKLILGYESLLNESGRAEARAKIALSTMFNKNLIQNSAR